MTWQERLIANAKTARPVQPTMSSADAARAAELIVARAVMRRLVARMVAENRPSGI